MEPDNPALDRYILSLWRGSVPEPRVCFIPPEHSDDYIHRFYTAFEKLPCRPTHLSLTGSETSDPIAVVSQNDILYVGGGNTRKMLAIWREHGLDQALREAWQAGKILCGISAGAICWFEQAISDSVQRMPKKATWRGAALVRISFTLACSQQRGCNGYM